MKGHGELRGLPEVAAAPMTMEQGGLPETVIRMLVHLAENRRIVKRDQLERSVTVLTHCEPFTSLGADRGEMFIPGQLDELSQRTLTLLHRFREVLDLAP